MEMALNLRTSTWWILRLDGYIEPSGGDIADGDNHIWCGDRKILIGGGGCKDLEKLGKINKSAVLGKSVSRNDSDGEESAVQKKNSDVEVTDLIMRSSPVPEPNAPSGSPNPRLSSPVNYICKRWWKSGAYSSCSTLADYEIK